MVLQFFKDSINKVKSALTKARSYFGDKLRLLFNGPINTETLEQLEQLLYEADFGVKTSMELTERVKKIHKENPNTQTSAYIEDLRTYLIDLMSQHPSELSKPLAQHNVQVILIVGVNGNGKTTSAAKLARHLLQSGYKVLLGGADTFRAAAMEQLSVWAERLNIDLVKGNQKSDPASVAFDAVQAGKSRGVDYVIIDTAGRLHTKSPLMQELEKIRRSCQKASSGCPQETLLVLDATTGQNAIEQAKQFHKTTPLTGLILTKLDGTAKGGIVVAIQRELKIPVKFIGLGEGIDDLQPFDAQVFINNLLG